MSQTKHDLEVMRTLAASKGGECISESFVSVAKKMRWRCGDCGYEWEAAPKTILYGYHDSWCPACGMEKRKKTRRINHFETLRKLARSKGGECISQDYVSNDDPLLWMCSAGHEWTATARSISQRKTWCRKCMNAERKAGK